MFLSRPEKRGLRTELGVAVSPVVEDRRPALNQRRPQVLDAAARVEVARLGHAARANDGTELGQHIQICRRRRAHEDAHPLRGQPGRWRRRGWREAIRAREDGRRRPQRRVEGRAALLHLGLLRDLRSGDVNDGSASRRRERAGTYTRRADGGSAERADWGTGAGGGVRARGKAGQDVFVIESCPGGHFFSRPRRALFCRAHRFPARLSGATRHPHPPLPLSPLPQKRCPPAASERRRQGSSAPPLPPSSVLRLPMAAAEGPRAEAPPVTRLRTSGAGQPLHPRGRGARMEAAPPRGALLLQVFLGGQR
jgi:hypothetical protein